MAGFRTHITVSTLCGIGYGIGAHELGMTPEAGILAGGITAVGGMLPDLDHDNGTPLREMCSFSAAIVPLMLAPGFASSGLSQEGTLAALGGIYLFIRYGVAAMLRRLSVHRGMFHSIPAMVISGLAVYLGYRSPDLRVRLLLSGGVMVGFLSHLILDELYSVDFNGVRIKLNSYAGSAVKFTSPSFVGTTICWLILCGLGYLAYLDWTHK